MLKSEPNRYNIKREKKFRLRLLFRKKFIFLNTFFQKALNCRKNFSATKVNFRVTQNNIFCTLGSVIDHKILEVGSAGKYKISVSKKTLRYNTKILISIFLKKIKLWLRKNFLLVTVMGPSHVRKPIIKQIFEQIGVKTSIIASVNSKKCFNGCRPRKKRRKKQKGLRIFK